MVRCALFPALFRGHFHSAWTWAGNVRSPLPGKTKLRENQNNRPVAVTLTPEPCNLSGPYHAQVRKPLLHPRLSRCARLCRRRFAAPVAAKTASRGSHGVAVARPMRSGTVFTTCTTCACRVISEILSCSVNVLCTAKQPVVYPLEAPSKPRYLLL